MILLLAVSVDFGLFCLMLRFVLNNSYLFINDSVNNVRKKILSPGRCIYVYVWGHMS